MSRTLTPHKDLITHFASIDLELIADAAHYHRLIV